MNSDPSEPAPHSELVEELFSTAIEMSPDERGRFLDQRCPGQPRLRRAVEDLLRASARAGEAELWKSPALVTAARQSAGSVPFDRLGPYRVLSQIGIGGMGAVYLAERDDDGVRRRMAIKLVPYALADAGALRRFQQERQILAALDHPNIARMLDAGRTREGLPYLAMEYVEGVRIDKYVRDKNLPVARTIELFRAVCGAVSYAHSRLVVHRDLKPGNILVTADGVPKLLDFGIAKLLDDGAPPDATSTRVMTARYASPEQLAGRQITTASDVYSLGVILGDLLARETPETRLAGDLGNIISKARRDEPERRYSSVEQLSDDLERYLEHRPVSARPDTAWYRTGKYVRRHWAVLLAAAIAFGGISTGAAVATYQARLARRQFDQVRDLANRFLFDFHDAIANTPGTLKAREMVVSTALEYLNRLSAESAGDRGLQWELAVAWGKVAAAQGSPTGPSLSRYRDALASYGKAFAIARPLADRHALTSAQTGVLVTLLCDAEAVYRYLREYDNAARIGREAVARSAGLAASAQLRPLSEMARSIELLGDLNDSLSAQQQVLRAAREYAQTEPSLPNRLRVGSTLIDLGVAQMRVTSLEEAEASEREAIAILQPLAAGQPNDLSVKQRLYTALSRLADVLGAGDRPSLERFRESAASYEDAIRVLAPLAASDSNDTNTKLQLAILHNKIAWTLEAVEPDKALQHAAQAISIADAAARDRPEMKAQPRIIAAAVRLARGQFLEAERLLNEAGRFPRERDRYTHADWSLAWARLEAARGQRDAAVARFARAIAEMQQLYQERRTPGYAWALAQRLDLAARAFPESAKSYRHAILVVWDEQNRRYPGHPYIAQRVAEARVKLGE